MESRFKRELRGDYGQFWQEEAKKKVESVRSELRDGQITISPAGVARNCIGRVLMDDLAEVVAMVTDDIDLAATASAREVEVSCELAEYRRKKRAYSEEEVAEMRSVFGTDRTIVNVLTGETTTI